MKRVLVPLDTTETGEEILPLIAMLAKGDATVRLLHVARIPEAVVGDDGRTVVYSNQVSASMEGVWGDYVESVKARFGIEVEAAIRFGDPATEILAEAAACDADTIALTTGTPSALRRALLGSIGETTLRRANIGVLLYRPPTP